MKISISTFLILFILGFLPVSCLWICKEFYIGKYDIELKTSSAIASGNLTYDSTRIVTGIETDSVLNSSYFFGCSVTTISKKIASVSSINFTNYSHVIQHVYRHVTIQLQQDLILILFMFFVISYLMVFLLIIY